MTLRFTKLLNFSILICACFLANSVQAQTPDPAITEISIDPTPVYFPTQPENYQKIAFSIENKGGNVSSSSVEFVISLSNLELEGPFDPGVNIVRLSGTVEFTYFYSTELNTLFATLAGIWPAGEKADFEFINLKVINENNSGQPATGANFNFSVPATFNATTSNDNLPILVNTSPFVPTPVILSSFNASSFDCSAKLTWTSASEKEFDHYLIQYSRDGINFSDIMKIKGQNKASAYNQVVTAMNGMNYYRLKMVDINGSTTYSSVRQISSECNRSKEITISPNPTNGFSRINISASAGEYVMDVLDTYGNVVGSDRVNISNESGSTVLELNKKLPNGIYFIRLSTAGGVAGTGKIILNN